MKKPNIIWYCFCWNEMDILPFMIDYWYYIASKVVVFDNGSTDGSLDLLAKYDWIEVRPYPIDSHDQMNDAVHQEIRNMCWKECIGKEVDWVIVSDLDETIWCKDLFNTLNKYKAENISIVKPRGLDFVSETFPIYDGEHLAHDIVKHCTYTPHWNKPIIFDPNKVSEINYEVGGHNIVCPVFSGIFTNPDNFYLFHFKYLSKEYLIRKRFATRARLSEINVRNGWGFEYLFNEAQITEQFNDKLHQATIMVDDLLNK